MTDSVNILTQISNADHERIQICRDEATGLHAILAVHSTKLGAAMGAVRMQHYSSEGEALSDVLRLARDATLKSALAGLKFGGGAAVIIGDPRTQKTPALLRSFARFVDSLGGKFVVTQDRGMEVTDLEVIREETPCVASFRGSNGDSSPFTAMSVFVSIVTAVKRLTGSEDLYGRKILVQGTGKVGLALVRQLCHTGATVYACDLRDSALRPAIAAGARAMPLSAMTSLMVDVYAPCATGGIFNPTTIPQLQCAIVAGAADNQLADAERDGQALHDRGILCVPDFVANAGDFFAVATEANKGCNPELGADVARNIRQIITDLFGDCDRLGITPHQAAIRRAETYLQSARSGRMAWGRTQFGYHQTTFRRPLLSPFAPLQARLNS
jgi:leucine dehydrogenase